MVAPAQPEAAVWCFDQRLRLGQVEVADALVLVALGRDRDHPGDCLGVLGMFEGGVAVEGVDCREAIVARADAVAADRFEVGEKRADQLGVEVVEVQLKGLFAGLLLRECEQEPDRVAVGGDRFRTAVALRDQPLGEERLQSRGDPSHESPPKSAPDAR